MYRKIITLIILFAGLTGLNSIKSQTRTDFNQQWPSFRGPGACGYLSNSKTPVTWDYNNMQNIKWKTPIPGLAHSSPVIWDNWLFVTTATTNMNDESLKLGLYGDIDEADDKRVHEFKVYCR